MYSTIEEARKAIGNSHFPGCDILLSRLVYQTYDGDPTNNVTPNFIGELCYDSSANLDFYQAVGLTSADWKQVTA